MGYALRYEYGMFRQDLRTGWQSEQPDHWLARPDPGEVPQSDEAVEVKLNVSFEIRGGTLCVVQGRLSSLVGIPYDRPVVGITRIGITTTNRKRAALDLIASNQFSRNELGIFNPILDALLNWGEHYRHLADLSSYDQAHERLGRLHTDPEAWTRKAIRNIAASGRFSSDRTIAEYAKGIWNAQPCSVE